ncbi:MAG: hypothetical protein KTR14_10870 [Vampirovibrio sp.]|nr:hypothetical protein [Vampirovibrio sp.]
MTTTKTWFQWILIATMMVSGSLFIWQGFNTDAPIQAPVITETSGTLG